MACSATCADVLRHPWLKHAGHGMDKPLDNVVLSRMKNFAAMNKMKKTALMVVGSCLSSDEIAGMKRLFKSIDTDGSGTITVKELQARRPSVPCVQHAATAGPSPWLCAIPAAIPAALCVLCCIDIGSLRCTHCRTEDPAAAPQLMHRAPCPSVHACLHPINRPSLHRMFPSSNSAHCLDTQLSLHLCRTRSSSGDTRSPRTRSWR